MTDRIMTNAGADVIQAVWGLDQAEEGGRYGPMGAQIKRAKWTLNEALTALAAEGDGEWTHPGNNG